MNRQRVNRNAIMQLRSETLTPKALLQIGARRLAQTQVFCSCLEMAARVNIHQNAFMLKS